MNGLAHQESLVAQWLEPPNGIWEAIGSIPVGTQDFFCPTLVTNEHVIFVNVKVFAARERKKERINGLMSAYPQPTSADEFCNKRLCS